MAELIDVDILWVPPDTTADKVLDAKERWEEMTGRKAVVMVGMRWLGTTQMLASALPDNRIQTVEVRGGYL